MVIHYSFIWLIRQWLMHFARPLDSRTVNRKTYFISWYYFSIIHLNKNYAFIFNSFNAYSLLSINFIIDTYLFKLIKQKHFQSILYFITIKYCFIVKIVNINCISIKFLKSTLSMSVGLVLRTHDKTNLLCSWYIHGIKIYRLV